MKPLFRIPDRLIPLCMGVCPVNGALDVPVSLFKYLLPELAVIQQRSQLYPQEMHFNGHIGAQQNGTASPHEEMKNVRDRNINSSILLGKRMTATRTEHRTV